MIKRMLSELVTGLKSNYGYILICLLGVAIPLILILILILKYAVNVPFGDDWAMVPLFKHIDTGSLTFGDLWAQHNEHRILFPRLVILALAYTTHWHLGVEMLTSTAISLFSIIMIVFIIWKTINNKVIATITTILSSAWFYSTAQWENWLWGWQIEWFMCVAAFLGATALLATSSGKNQSRFKYLLVFLFGVVATLSLGSGVLVWPILVLWLLLDNKRKKYI
jgi:hypothetical protein